MAAQNVGTSFRQFEFCSLCKLSHTTRKKHIYSKRHQHILNNILKKFSSKIETVKQDLFSPQVQDEQFENGATFWCYFCTNEYNKHTIMENCTVIGAGLLEHIASDSHKENMVQFFWDNLLNKKLKPNFILSPEDLRIFKKACFLAVKKWQKAKEIERLKIAETITSCEMRWQVCGRMDANQSESFTSATELMNLPGHREHDAPGTTNLPGYRGPELGLGKRTISARAPGLTCIIQNTYEEGIEGNVHTAAIPPWLQKDTDSNQSQEIGPTMVDLQKHLEREKKSKLPSMRVGAKFDHSAATSQAWLPSFGRVWSKGRRLQSKQHFEKQWKGEQKFSKKSHPSVSSSTIATTETKHAPNQSWRKNSPNTSETSHHSGWSKNVKDLKSTNPSIGQSDQSQQANGDQFITNQIVPYKRKHDQARDWPNSQSNGAQSSNKIVPYKRQRHHSHDSQTNQMGLLQTPVLATWQF